MAVYQIKKDTWQIDIITGYNKDGKRKRHYETFKGLKKEAIAREAELKAKSKSGMGIANDSCTFNDFCEIWLEKYADNSLAPKTLAEYKRLLQIILPFLGNYKLKNIKPIILINLYNDIRNSNPRLSESSILRYYALINKILNSAVKWEFTNYNANEKVDKPRPIKHEAKYYNIEQTQKLIKAVSKECLKYQAIIHLALDTGARRGELTGLEWDKVNFEENYIKIEKVTQRAGGLGIIEKAPKTESSKRKTYITTHTANILKRLKEEQQTEKQKLGIKWIHSNKVFITEFGDRMDPNTPSYILKNIIKKHNLDPIHFHGLRHTSVSLLISQGIHTQIISKRVGHSSSATTQNIYSHVFETSEKEAVNKLSKLLI